MDFQLTKVRKESLESMYIRLNSVIIMSTMLMKVRCMHLYFQLTKLKKSEENPCILGGSKPLKVCLHVFATIVNLSIYWNVTLV